MIYGATIFPRFSSEYSKALVPPDKYYSNSIPPVNVKSTFFLYNYDGIRYFAVVRKQCKKGAAIVTHLNKQGCGPFPRNQDFSPAAVHPAGSFPFRCIYSFGRVAAFRCAHLPLVFFFLTRVKCKPDDGLQTW